MTSRSLDLQTLQANSSSSKIKCRAGAPALFSGPSLCPQTSLLATGIIWCYFISCATMQMFFSDELLSFLTHFRKWGSLSDLFFISRPPESSFSPGISNHTVGSALFTQMWEITVMNSLHLKQSLHPWRIPCESPEVAYALINVNISETLVSWRL